MGVEQNVDCSIGAAFRESGSLKEAP